MNTMKSMLFIRSQFSTTCNNMAIDQSTYYNLMQKTMSDMSIYSMCSLHSLNFIHVNRDDILILITWRVATKKITAARIVLYVMR